MKRFIFFLLAGITMASCRYFSSGSSGGSALDARLKNSISGTDAFNAHLLRLFERALQHDGIMARPYYDRAETVKKSASELDAFLESSKSETAKVPVQTLAGKIYAFRDALMQASASYNKELLEKLFACFDTLQFPDKAGEELTRYLTFIQHDLRKCEQSVLQSLYEDMDAPYYKFDTLALKAVPEKEKVKVGDYYSAEFFLAAFRSTSNPKFVTGNWDWMKNRLVGEVDSVSMQVSRGVGILRQKAEKPGKKKFTVVARIKSPFDDSMEEFPVDVEYTVVKK